MIIEMIQEWFKELLIDGIISNLSGTFDTVNTKVGEIAGEVGMTPAGWNGGIFNMIRGLSETVIVPIAGIILTFVMCYELIQLIAHDEGEDDACDGDNDRFGQAADHVEDTAVPAGGRHADLACDLGNLRIHGIKGPGKV